MFTSCGDLLKVSQFAFRCMHIRSDTPFKRSQDVWQTSCLVPVDLFCLSSFFLERLSNLFSWLLVATRPWLEVSVALVPSTPSSAVGRQQWRSRIPSLRVLF